ncbi:MAG: tetratricopeptide repeat protein, partial [Gallionella sp.]|nr:tetratricopeptide repeat protein [Gallionella sp.]
MNILNRLPLSAALLFSILTISPALHANELQDATQLFKQGQHSQALSKVNNFLSSKPRDAQGRFLQGLIFTEQGKIPDAIKVFSSLTADYPELPEPYNNLAVLYASQSQYDKAKSSLEMAIRTHPSYATAHENLGDIYAKMASQAYDRALQLDNTNTTTQTKLAMIQDLFTDKSRVRPGAARNPALPSRPVAAAPVAVAKPVAAATVSAPPVQTSAASDKMLSVLEAVDAWAAAWSSKNVKKYLSHYSNDFKTPDGESRKAWAETRKDRISRPKYIDVKVSNGTVDFTDDTHATVKFHQD